VFNRYTEEVSDSSGNKIKKDLLPDFIEILSSIVVDNTLDEK
jgi:hypothetical protein